MIDLAAIEQAALVRFIATAPGVYPLVSAAHILGISLLLGSILVVDLRLLGALGPRLDPALPVMTRVAIGGFVLAAATGLTLASVQIAAYAANPAFLTKLGLIAFAGANAALFAWRGRAGRLAAALSLLSWLAVLVAGRWIAFAV